MEKGRREIAKSAERSLALYIFSLSLCADPCTDLLPSAFDLFAASGSRPLPFIIDFVFFKTRKSCWNVGGSSAVPVCDCL